MKPRKNVLFIGPVSYVGGISIHIKRLSKLLNDDLKIMYIDDSPPSLKKNTTNIRRLFDWPKSLLFFYKSDTVFVHSGNWLLRVIAIIIGKLFNKKTIVTLHSFRLNGLKRKLTKNVLSLCDKIICVNEDIQKKICLPHLSVIKEAFIPPSDNFSDLPTSVSEYISHSRNDGAFIICANAYKLVEFDGKDLYGLDQSVSLAQNARDRSLNISIVFVVATVDENNRFLIDSKTRIEKLGLSDYIFIYEGSLDFANLISSADLVLRPTLTDGDALTIREAIFFGKPVIASNIVQRPKGCSVYQIDSPQNLFEVLVNCINEDNELSYTNFIYDKPSDYRKFYLELLK